MQICNSTSCWCFSNLLLISEVWQALEVERHDYTLDNRSATLLVDKAEIWRSRHRSVDLGTRVQLLGDADGNVDSCLQPLNRR